MKQITRILIAFTVLAACSWLVLRYAPQWFPNLPFISAEDSNNNPDDYRRWRDSLDQLDLQIRSEQDPSLVKIHKDRRAYFWKRLQAVKENLEATAPHSPDNSSPHETSSAQDDQTLIAMLAKILTVTAVVLGLLILLLLGLLKKKRERLTQQLDAIKEDHRFRMPRSGFESSSDPANTTPEPSEDFSTTEPEQPPPALQRPTARQRVTSALKGLAETLAALKEDSATTSEQSGPRGVPGRTRRPRPRVRSHSQVPSTQALDMQELADRQKGVMSPSRYEQEQQEKSDILKLARRGYTSSEIARRLRISQDQVETIIRLQREGS